MNHQLSFQEVTKRHVLTYTITHNLNTAYEEAELYEYGIDCSLYDLYGNLLSSESVRCVSANLETVMNLCYTLKRNLVYPVHMKEILDELISEEISPNTTPLMCA